MTVSELIEELRKYPGDAIVLLFDSKEWFYYEPDKIIEHKEFNPTYNDGYNGKHIVELG